MFEAQQAHYYGLNPALALASVTSTTAKAAGMDHQVGTIAEGLSVTYSLSFHQDFIFAAIQDMMLVRIHVHPPVFHTILKTTFCTFFLQISCVWVSHPLSLGATPGQVYIDG